MKKLIIAAAIVCAAVVTQAASVSWTVTTTRKPQADGTYTASGNIGADGTLSIFLINDAATYASLTFDQAFYDTYSKKTADYTGATNMGTLKLTSGDTYSKDDHVYAAILLTYNDGKDTWFVANKADVVIAEFDGVAQDAAILKLNTLRGGEGGIFSGDAIAGWTKASAVPEPTSAMLLLLGMAGLALRRRRA